MDFCNEEILSGLLQKLMAAAKMKNNVSYFLHTNFCNLVTW